MSLLHAPSTWSINGRRPASLFIVLAVAATVLFAATPPALANTAPTITGITGPTGPVATGDLTLVTVNFDDPDTADVHQFTFEWGDGASATQGSPVGGYEYLTPGVYSVTITVDDQNGGIATFVYEFIVAYDPDGDVVTDGFVTGGGWIDSPPGAYAADPALAGKANFGFVSKYKKGATIPTGNTQFRFKAGDLDFHSSSYDWLVVGGDDKAKYKGSGTINGGGDYGFMLTAVDNGNSGDTFRIKIWDKNNGDAVVYDNKLGDGDGGFSGTLIGGGSIKVHKN